jgi:hypothetical protein
MRMVESRGQLDFTQETFGGYTDRQIGSKYLESDGAIMPAVPGKVHRRHCTGPKLTVDLVPIDEQLP